MMKAITGEAVRFESDFNCTLKQTFRRKIGGTKSSVAIAVTVTTY